MELTAYVELRSELARLHGTVTALVARESGNNSRCRERLEALECTVSLLGDTAENKNEAVCGAVGRLSSRVADLDRDFDALFDKVNGRIAPNGWKDRPTEPGWYWFVYGPHKQVSQVEQQEIDSWGGLLKAGRWYGPIAEPE